jgi:hypothetical protein
MDSDNKQTGWSWGWWLGIGLAVLLIAYPLSLGPVEWSIEDADIPRWMQTALEWFYAPISTALDYLPRSVVKAYVRYVRWWTPNAA